LLAQLPCFLPATSAPVLLNWIFCKLICLEQQDIYGTNQAYRSHLFHFYTMYFHFTFQPQGEKIFSKKSFSKSFFKCWTSAKAEENENKVKIVFVD
jgi:hypothetical protein